MIATTGASLLPVEAVNALRTRLLPHATIVTPNVPEALKLLSGLPYSSATDEPTIPQVVQSVADLEILARTIARRLGPQWVLVKGGHCPFRKDETVAKEEEEKELVVDVLVGRKQRNEKDEELVVMKVETEYCRTKDTHGTGCSLACEFPLLPLDCKSVPLTDFCSGYRIEPGEGDGCPGCGTGCLSLRRCWYQDSSRAGQRQRAIESFPFCLHSTVCPVRTSTPVFDPSLGVKADLLSSGVTSLNGFWNSQTSRLYGTSSSIIRLSWRWVMGRSPWSRSKDT